MKDKLKEKKWYPLAVALCIPVILYVLLTHLGPINAYLSKFTGYFGAVILGLILAYLMNPLAKFYQNKVLKNIGQKKAKWSLAALLAVVTMLLFLIFVLGTMIPQLVDSIRRFLSNIDTYVASLDAYLAKTGTTGLLKGHKLAEYFSNFNEQLVDYLGQNAEAILNASAAAGKTLVKWAIAFILSIYMLMAKDPMKKGAKRLLHALLPERSYNSTISYLKRCDKILVDYIVFSLLDSLIVGVVNAIFMTLAGMEYVGIVSMLVAVTNLIPNFGPLIGGAIGGFILLLVNPLDALLFVLFTLVLQFLDG